MTGVDPVATMELAQIGAFERLVVERSNVYNLKKLCKMSWQNNVTVWCIVP